MQNITIYTTNSCPWCIRLKEFLKHNKIEFKEHNVREDQKATHEMIKKSGQYGVPVIDISGTIIVGFDKERISKILKIK